MISFKARLAQFGEQGEKTGWTYLQVPAKQAQKLMPGNKRSFRVKGKIDHYAIKQVALVPMGEGNFILAVNATMRKAIKKHAGHDVKVELEVDNTELKPPPEFIECLKDEPAAWKNYQALARSHQHYFIRWISSAKTDETKAKRIAAAVSGLSIGAGIAAVMQKIRELNKERKGW